MDKPSYDSLTTQPWMYSQGDLLLDNLPSYKESLITAYQMKQGNISVIAHELNSAARANQSVRLQGALAALKTVLKSPMSSRLLEEALDENCLEAAIRCRSVDAVRVLLKHADKELIFALSVRGTYSGATALHLAILCSLGDIIDDLLDCLSDQDRKYLVQSEAQGPLFQNKLPVGSLPLTLALCFGLKDIFEKLMRRGACLDAKDSTMGNTAIHSLIVYAAYVKQPVIDMLQFLIESEESKKWHRKKSEDGSTSMSQWHEQLPNMFREENSYGYTPLTLAARLGVTEVVDFLLHLEGPYKETKWKLGPCSYTIYDVTELDPVLCPVEKSNKPTVVEFLVYGGGEECLDLLVRPPLSDLAETRWSEYRVVIIVWAIIHLLVMITLSLATAPVYVEQTKVETVNSSVINSTHHSWVFPKHRLHLDAAVVSIQHITEAIPFLLALVYLVLQLLSALRRFLVFRHSVRDGKMSGPARVPLSVLFKFDCFEFVLLIFNITVIVGSLLDWLENAEATAFLAISLATGWYFCLFFLRVWQPTAFAIFMIHRVICRNVLPLTIIVVFILTGFSLAFLLLFKETNGGRPETFSDAGLSMLAMFRLMTGLGDIDPTFMSPFPTAATCLYLIFVALTVVCALNMLVASMCDTYLKMTKDRPQILQKLRLLTVLQVAQHLPGRAVINLTKTSFQIQGNAWYLPVHNVAPDRPKKQERTNRDYPEGPPFTLSRPT